MRYFPVRYGSRVLIYERKMFIRLATDVATSSAASHLPLDLPVLFLRRRFGVATSIGRCFFHFDPSTRQKKAFDVLDQ